MGALWYAIRAKLVNLMYRVIAPRHPRGWLDMHAVYEDAAHPTIAWVHSHGMARWGLPDMEIVDVPHDLTGYAHGILFDLLGYTKNRKPMKPDENFGGLFVRSDQFLHHIGTVRAAPPRPDAGHPDYLRIVDYGQPADAGFPSQLFAAHLCCLAEAAKAPAYRERLSRRACEIFRGSIPAAPGGEFEPHVNVNNYFAWRQLGDALCDQGRTDEGIACLEESVARYPAAAELMAKFAQDELAAGVLPPPDRDPRSRFWTTLDIPRILAERSEQRDGAPSSA